MINLIQSAITEFISLAEEFFQTIFGNVQFSILWSWLPTDIQTAAVTFIVILFAIAIIRGVRAFLPF